MKRVSLAAGFLAVAALVAGCGSSPSAPAAALALSQSSAALARTETVQVSATSTSAGLSIDVTSTATWRSSNVAVATVSAGLIRAIGPGSARITIEHGGASASIEVAVRRRVYLRGALTVSQSPVTNVRGGIGGLQVTIDGAEVGDRGYSGHDYERSVEIGDNPREQVDLAPGQHDLNLKIETYNGDGLDKYTFTITFDDLAKIVDIDTGEQVGTVQFDTRTQAFGENPETAWTITIASYAS